MSARNEHICKLSVFVLKEIKDFIEDNKLLEKTLCHKCFSLTSMALKMSSIYYKFAAAHMF